MFAYFWTPHSISLWHEVGMQRKQTRRHVSDWNQSITYCFSADRCHTFQDVLLTPAVDSVMVSVNGSTAKARGPVTRGSWNLNILVTCHFEHNPITSAPMTHSDYCCGAKKWVYVVSRVEKRKKNSSFDRFTWVKLVVWMQEDEANWLMSVFHTGAGFCFLSLQRFLGSYHVTSSGVGKPNPGWWSRQD